MLKQLFCRHRQLIADRCYLETMKNGHKRTVIVWKCTKCGKEVTGKRDK